MKLKNYLLSLTSTRIFQLSFLDAKRRDSNSENYILPWKFWIHTKQHILAVWSNFKKMEFLIEFKILFLSKGIINGLDALCRSRKECFRISQSSPSVQDHMWMQIIIADVSWHLLCGRPLSSPICYQSDSSSITSSSLSSDWNTHFFDKKVKMK